VHVEIVKYIEVATFGEVDDALEHASEVLRSVRIKHAATASLTQYAAALTL
jgi:hypothetical protein